MPRFAFTGDCEKMFFKWIVSGMKLEILILKWLFKARNYCEKLERKLQKTKRIKLRNILKLRFILDEQCNI